MLSARTIARLVEAFESEAAPSDATIEAIFAVEDALPYLGEGDTTRKRVFHGLDALRHGSRATDGQAPLLEADHQKLHRVAARLAEHLFTVGLVDQEWVEEALVAPWRDEADMSPKPQRGYELQPDHEGPGAVRVPTSVMPRRASDPLRVMVVHGQDLVAARALFDWLRCVGLRPTEWNELVTASGVGSPFIGQVLDSAFERAQAVVVLFTPDEHVRLRRDLAFATWRLQARPNVLFEAGMAFATHPKQTVLVVLGDQELPSDLAGRHFVRLGSPQSLRDLGNRLEAAGCPVDLSGSDWLDTTRFPHRQHVESQPDGG